MKTIFHRKLFRIGALIQMGSLFLFLVMITSLTLGEKDIIDIGLEGGIDKPSPKLNALFFASYILFGTFVLGFTLCGFVWIKKITKKPNKSVSL